MDRLLRLPLLLILIALPLSHAAAQTKTWNGTESTSWNDGDNWTPSAPISNDTIVIPRTTTNPILDITAANFSLGTGSITIQNGAELDVNDKGISMSTITSASGTSTGSITINSGAELNINGGTITGGTITNNGTLKFNGKEVTTGTGTPFVPTTYTGSGEIHLVNTTGTDALTLPVSNSIPFSGGITAAVTVNVTPSSRIVNLSGPTTIGTTGIGGVSKNFELNGGTLTGGTGETFTVTGTSSLGGTITSAANVSLNGNLTLTADTAVTTTGTAALTFGGTIDTAPAPVAANRSLTVTTGTTNPAFSGNIGSNLPLGTLRIASGAASALTVTPSIGALNLALTGPSVNYTLTNSANSVDTLAANTGSLNYHNADGFAIGKIPASCTVGATGCTSGVNTNNNDFTLTAGGALSINSTVNAGTGTVSLQADGGIFQTAAGNITADKLKLTRGTAVIVNYILNNGSNNVNTLAAANTGPTTYHDTDGFDIGKIPAGCTVGAAGCTSGVTTNNRLLILQAGAGVTQSSGADIVVSALRLKGTGASYSLNNSGNNAQIIYGDPDVTGNISYNDTNELDIEFTIPGTTPGSPPTSFGLTSTSGSVSVTAGGTLGVKGSVSAGTSVTLYSGGGGGIQLEKAAAFRRITAGSEINLSTRGAGTITNTGTGAQSAVLSAPTINLQTQSGSSGAIGAPGTPPSAVLTSGTTTVNIGPTTGAAKPSTLYLKNTDDITINGTLTLGALNNMASNKTIWVQTDNGNPLVPASGAIAAGTGSIDLRSGTSFTTAGAYSTTGTDGISLAARDALTVSHNTTTSGGDIDITSDTSTIALNSRVSTVTGTAAGDVVLNAGGAVTQSAAITADGLRLLGTGTGVSYTLTNTGNDVNTLAANTGAVSYSNTGILTIGTVGSTVGVTTNNNDFNLTTVGTAIAGTADIDISNKIDAGTGNVVFNAGGAVTQSTPATAASRITAAGLVLKGSSASYELKNTSNTVTTLAADAGEVLYFDSGALSIGSVTAGGGTTAGVKTNGNNFRLKAGGAVTISGELNAGTGTTANILLEAAGGLTQGSGAAARIAAVGLALTRPSSAAPAAPVYTLNNSSNSVTTLAANTGTLTYHDSGGVTVGSVTVDSVTITGINTNAGALTINVSGAINQSSTPVAAITAGAANFTAKTTASPQDIVLDESTNDFTSVIFEGNNVTLRDSNVLILGGSTKTSSAGGNLTVTTGGAAGHNLTDNGAITVTGVTAIAAGTSGNVVLNNEANDFSSPDPPAATGGVTISSAANVTLVDSNDIQLNAVNIAGTGSLTVTVPPTPSTPPGAPTMYGINQTQPLSIPGNLTFKGDWNLRNNNLSAGLITTSSTAVGTGNLIAAAGGAAEQITVSGNFRPDTFIPADSKVIFSGASTSQVGDNTPGRVTLPYIFNDIEINKDTPSLDITALNGWIILDSAALTRGRWLLGANNHTINGNWNSISPNFTFVSAGSTVTFAGGNSTVTTQGDAPGQSFNNFVVRKTAGSKLSLGSHIKVDGNLTAQASSGAISAGANNMLIGGNWTYSADADAFEPGTGTVIFNNTAPAGSPKRITSGGSNFGNLTIRDNSRVNAKDALTVTGDLIFLKAAGTAGTAAPVLDIEGNSLTVNGSYNALIRTNTWPAPDELGRLRIRGSAAVSIPAATSGSALGTVEYYGPGAAALGRITTGTGPVEYWNLVISGGAAVTLNEDVRVLGYSGNPKETLDEPVETEYPEEDDLMGLYIKDAGSSLDLNGKTLTLYGSFQNRTGASSGFRHGRGTVTFLGSRPALIYGKSTFFKFNINDQSGTPAAPSNDDVGGKIVYFQQGSPITPASPVIEIANEIGAGFNILGDNRSGAPKSACAPRKCLTLPDPSPSSEWVYLVSSSKDTDWVFDKEPSASISLKYVYIRDSDATIHPQSIPNPETVTRPDGTTVERDIVITESSPGWLRFILVKESITQDSDSDGRIDRLLVTSESSMKRKVDGAYERLEIKVDGYTVSGYSDGPESTQFYINLVEGSTLDTDAVPKWSIINNETFRDAGVKAEVLSTRRDFEVPFDKARPIIGYALAAAGSPRNEVFIRFSEPVTDNNGGGWINNFNFRALENVSGNVSEVKIISPAGGTGLEEAVVKLGGKVTVQDIYENRKFIVENVKDGAGNELEESSPLKYNEHRVSDLALGITGSGIVQPASAASRTKPAGDSGVGTITEFDGTGFLEDDDIRIQAVRRKLPDTPTPPPLTKLFYDNSVSASFRSNGLWLPGFSEGNTSAGVRPPGTFSGLVPRPWNGARRSTDPKPLRVTSSPNTLFEYELKASDPKIVNNADLEFLFYMPRHEVGGDKVFGNLYAARLIDDTAADWYRGVRPWGFLIRDLVTQAGGVTVLNNIINPMRSEAASLHYEVTEGGTVTIQVFDLSGNLVEILQRGYQAPGEYSVSWNGRNRGGGIVARGIYFIRYVGPGRIDQIRKVLVVK